MSWETFDDNCKGCKPVIIDSKTGKAFAENSPQMLAVMAVWAQTTRAERVAFHNVTCLNSWKAADMILIESFGRRVEAALASCGNGPAPAQ